MKLSFPFLGHQVTVEPCESSLPEPQGVQHYPLSAIEQARLKRKQRREALLAEIQREVEFGSDPVGAA